ncbi:MAG TPA: sulfotransferase, partial [Solirubrobacteraceae bacterium]|nr:sulfotransferase [Solirubrobacteraceae bacterium]
MLLDAGPETRPASQPTAVDRSGAPVVILGVSRSGTTLLKEMLDRHSQLAIPSESYFIPQLWDRHGPEVDADAFVADLARLERIGEWGVDPLAVRSRLADRVPFHRAIQAIYRCYAEARGSTRFGDKTPLYMQRLDCLERAFPGAQYVHIVRDGRDACVSFLAMQRRPRFNWSRPRGVAGFAAQWRMEIEAARRLGGSVAAGRYMELSYERLVCDPGASLQDVCAFLGLDFEDAMLDYHRQVDPSALPDHELLAGPPRPARSRWREQMRPRDVRRFEAVAGELLARLGYDRLHDAVRPVDRAVAAAARATLRLLVASWWASIALVRRSPLWRLRQRYIHRTAGAQPDPRAPRPMSTA